LDKALKELAGDNDFISDSEDFFSEDKDEPASQFSAIATAVPARITTQLLQRYRKNGPFGKLHNIGAHLRKSSQLKQLFYEAQKLVTGERSLAWVQNVATRWSSDYAMAARALVLRRLLNRFFFIIKKRWVNDGSIPPQKPEILQYKLTSSEWQIISLLQLILKQFNISNKQLQGNPSFRYNRATRDRFNEYYPVIKLLLDHLENAIQGYIFDILVKGINQPMIQVNLFESCTLNYLQSPSVTQSFPQSFLLTLTFFYKNE
jgi:hypothetical protein